MLKLAIPLRYSIRALRRDLTFVCIVVLTLALGMGATTTIFTVVDQVLLSALPYRDASRVVMIWESNAAEPEPAGSHIPAARDNFDAWRKTNGSFSAIEAYRQASFNLTGLRIPESVRAARTTAGLLPMLGVSPIRGRAFRPDDEMPGHDHVAVLSYPFFVGHFQASNPLGQTLRLDGVPYTIVGVLPGNFHLPNILQGLAEYKPDIWIPLPPITTSDPPMVAKGRNLLVYARLKDSVSIAQARSEMRAIAGHLAGQNPNLDSGYSANVFSLDFENTDPDLKRALYILWVAVGFVLMLACANLAGLMLLRNATQERDLAIMASLGARRANLVITSTVQGLILALMGTLLGTLASYGGVRLIVALNPGEIHAVERIALNVHSMVFTASLFVAVSMVIALLPAWLGSRGDLSGALKQGQGLGIKTRPRSMSRSVLAAAEIAIALMLAIGSTLLIRSFQRLLEVNPGFGAQHVLTAHLSLPQPRYSASESRIQFCQRLVQNLESQPQVQSASLIDNMPLYSIRYAPFEIEGRPVGKIGEAPTADYANLTPGFFETMGIGIRSGRLFTEADAEENAAKVVVINEALAHQFWPNQDPVGTQIRSLDAGTGPWATIVGVVADFVQFNVDTPARPELFWPARQLGRMTVVIRTTGNPANLSPLLQKATWDIDKDLPISHVQTLDQILSDSISQARFNMAALTIFAGVGILLAIVGVHGLVAYLISSRTKEIGIRLALGAQRRHILSSLLRQTFPFVAAGIFIGVVTSLLSSKVMKSLVFGIASLDLVTYIVAPVCVLILMFGTVIFPARRATKIAPANVLRQE